MANSYRNAGAKLKPGAKPAMAIKIITMTWIMGVVYFTEEFEILHWKGFLLFGLKK